MATLSSNHLVPIFPATYLDSKGHRHMEQLAWVRHDKTNLLVWGLYERTTSRDKKGEAKSDCVCFVFFQEAERD